MKKLKYMWTKLDILNRILLVVAFGLCIYGILQKQAGLGLALLVVLCVLIVSRSNNQSKRLSRLYGAFFFYMPDGEIYPMTFEQVKAEYTHGEGRKYVGRRVTVRFPYCGLNEVGDLDTGFGLMIHAQPQQLQHWKRGQLLAVTGKITPVSGNYFRIDEVEEIRLTTDKEDLTVSTENHTKQEETQNEIHD